MQGTRSFDQFVATYVDTNTGSQAKKYDKEFFKRVQDDFVKVNPAKFSKIGLQVLVSMCCGMKRSDLVPSLFRDALQDRDSELTDQDGDGDGDNEVLKQFRTFQETLIIIWPFVGIPQVIPACLGLAGYLQWKGILHVDRSGQRQAIGPEDMSLGSTTRQRIYAASSNSEVFQMLENFYGDFAYPLNAVAFGFNIGRVDPDVFTLPETELILTTTLIGLNATRQARSHIKACIAFGFSERDIQAILDMAQTIAEWCGTAPVIDCSTIDVKKLAEQARENMGQRQTK